MIKNANTVEQTGQHNTVYLTFITLVAAMGGLLFGFDLGIITGVIPFIQKQFYLYGFELGWVVAIFELGCMFGAFFISFMTEKLGRKKALVTTAIFFIITTIGIVMSNSASELAIWRFLQGVAVGAASVLSPMYIAETSPAQIRGTLVSINQLMIIFGILLATFISYYFGDPQNADSWKYMFGFALVPSAIFLILLIFVPESPRWLLKKGLQKEAIKVLRKIGDDIYVAIEVKGININTEAPQRKARYIDLFGKSMLPVLAIGFGLAILQQFCGSNNITAYLQVIFQKANLDIKDGLLNAVFVSIVFFVSTVFAILLIDRIGRKKLLLIGTLLMAFFLFCLALSFNSTTVNGTLVVIFVMGFIGTYAFTLAPVTWVVLSEIFPNHIRGKALSMASAVLWLSCFIVVLISPYLLKVSAVVNFVIFGIFNICGFIFIWFYVPETMGKTLEQIEKMLFKPGNDENEI
ncbi:sugar porter family MFS transporter [Inquilinus sp. KBS0705]|nr:sugar porter family MFS transporter [Inquilinus sp. KBS0705]